jgi:hypothetical protein
MKKLGPGQELKVYTILQISFYFILKRQLARL